MKDGKNFSHYISHTSVDNDLPRKRQSEFMKKFMDLIDGPPRMIFPELFNL